MSGRKCPFSACYPPFTPHGLIIHSWHNVGAHIFYLYWREITSVIQLSAFVTPRTLVKSFIHKNANLHVLLFFILCSRYPIALQFWLKRCRARSVDVEIWSDFLRGPPFNLRGGGGLGGWSFCRGQIIYFNPARRRAEKNEFYYSFWSLTKIIYF